MMDIEEKAAAEEEEGARADVTASPLLKFSTEPQDGIPFEVDGEIFEIKTLDAASPADEIEMRALLRREAALEQRLNEESKSDKSAAMTLARSISSKLTKLRNQQLLLITDMRPDVVDKLSQGHKQQIIEYGVGVRKPKDAILRQAASLSAVLLNNPMIEYDGADKRSTLLVLYRLLGAAIGVREDGSVPDDDDTEDDASARIEQAARDLAS